MNRTEFSAPYLVALYKEHRSDPGFTPSVRELLGRYILPRDEYFEGQVQEFITGNGWASSRDTLADTQDAALEISFAGKSHAENLLDRGVDPALKDHPDRLAGDNKIPASDRIVTLSDNFEAVGSASTALNELSDQLTSGNDLGDLTPEEVAEARQEVWFLQEVIKREAVRVDWIEHLAKISLRWIASKAAEQLVGMLAVAALAAFAALFGFSL